VTKIAIITGSTRPGRKNEAVAAWVHKLAVKRDDASFELIDIADYDLPLLDEALPPFMGRYAKAHTIAWAETIDSFDGFVFVTAEYNHGPSGALKNAIDFLSQEWQDKAAGFVGYGGAGGARAVEHLRQIVGSLHVADVRNQVVLTLAADFENYTDFRPAAHQEAALAAMLDQVVAWSGALKRLRARDAVSAS
jgi:NAD(P)H-dependent FMN reductase